MPAHMKINPLVVALGGMIAMASAMGIGRFVYTPILPFMAEALALTKSQAGLIAAANYLGYFVGSLIGAAGFMGSNRRGWAMGALAASALLRVIGPRSVTSGMITRTSTPRLRARASSYSKASSVKYAFST